MANTIDIETIKYCYTVSKIIDNIKGKAKDGKYIGLNEMYVLYMLENILRENVSGNLNERIERLEL